MTTVLAAPTAGLDPALADFYRAAMKTLERARVPFLVGGAYAFAQYTAIERHTCDFDLFLMRQDVERALAAARDAGWRAELTFPHWLGKIHQDGAYVDLIYSSGSGIAVVDAEWFTHSVAATVLGRPARLIPAEEMIWSKAFVMERERYDGNDVAHLLLERGDQLDWPRLLRRFGEDWRLLFGHLVMFGYVFPGEIGTVPPEVWADLTQRLAAEHAQPPARDRLCRGTLISRAQYLTDVKGGGYRDARLDPRVHMTPEDIAHWTRAIEQS